jgi:hypothetical protein
MNLRLIVTLSCSALFSRVLGQMAPAAGSQIGRWRRCRRRRWGQAAAGIHLRREEQLSGKKLVVRYNPVDTGRSARSWGAGAVRAGVADGGESGGDTGDGVT